MLGPIIQQELRHAGRRTRLHLLRWAYALWLVVQLLYFLPLFPGAVPFWRLLPATEQLIRFLLLQQLLLLVLVAPAYTAGAITQEKERGTLQLLLTAGFTAADVVAGKFLARLGEPLLLLLTALPLVCFYVGLREAHWLVALTLGLLPLGPLLGLGAAGVLASVWTRTTREALLAVYTVGLAAALAVWSVGGPLQGLDPLSALDAAWGEPHERVVPYQDALTGTETVLVVIYHEAPDLGELAARLLGSLLAWAVLTAVCLALAVWRLRPAYLRQLARPGGGRRGAGWRPAVGADPLRWKECHVEGLAPLPVLRRVPTWLAAAVVSLGTLAVAVLLLWQRRGGPDLWPVLSGLATPGERRLSDQVLTETVLLLLSSILVVTGVRAATAISGERERQTWDGLLVTPLTSRQLVQGKLRGIVAAGRQYLLAAGIPALLLALCNGPAAVVLVALALMLGWWAVRLVAAIGLDASERFPSSWKSIVATLVSAAGQAVGYLLVSPFVLVLAGLPSLAVALLAGWLGLVPLWSAVEILLLLLGCVLAAAIYRLLFAWQTETYLIRAEKYVELSRPPPPLGSERRLGWPGR
jgi:ABC-type transport system involved in multi-copper enzyme maturation permease subunit